jgi:hypothetical protein
MHPCSDLCSDIWVLFFSPNRWDYLALFLGRLHAYRAKKLRLKKMEHREGGGSYKPSDPE